MELTCRAGVSTVTTSASDMSLVVRRLEHNIPCYIFLVDGYEGLGLPSKAYAVCAAAVGAAARRNAFDLHFSKAQPSRGEWVSQMLCDQRRLQLQPDSCHRKVRNSPTPGSLDTY